ncbi:unnamed protein product [Amoebophrya sp. A25]|nr:unnamed protein product [Amoebophrya sp. A25]|eukprot:GSA25T00025960001.1
MAALELQESRPMEEEMNETPPSRNFQETDVLQQSSSGEKKVEKFINILNCAGNILAKIPVRNVCRRTEDMKVEEDIQDQKESSSSCTGTSARQDNFRGDSDRVLVASSAVNSILSRCGLPSIKDECLQMKEDRRLSVSSVSTDATTTAASGNNDKQDAMNEEGNHEETKELSAADIWMPALRAVFKRFLLCECADVNREVLNLVQDELTPDVTNWVGYSRRTIFESTALVKRVTISTLSARPSPAQRPAMLAEQGKTRAGDASSSRRQQVNDQEVVAADIAGEGGNAADAHRNNDADEKQEQDENPLQNQSETSSGVADSDDDFFSALLRDESSSSSQEKKNTISSSGSANQNISSSSSTKTTASSSRMTLDSNGCTQEEITNCKLRIYIEKSNRAAWLEFAYEVDGWPMKKERPLAYNNNDIRAVRIVKSTSSATALELDLVTALGFMGQTCRPRKFVFFFSCGTDRDAFLSTLQSLRSFRFGQEDGVLVEHQYHEWKLNVNQNDESLSVWDRRDELCRIVKSEEIHTRMKELVLERSSILREEEMFFSKNLVEGAELLDHDQELKHETDDIGKDRLHEEAMSLWRKFDLFEGLLANLRNVDLMPAEEFGCMAVDGAEDEGEAEMIVENFSKNVVAIEQVINEFMGS